MFALSSGRLVAQLPTGFEWIIIAIIVIILLLFGPQKLPELARGIGRALGEFRRGKMQIDQQITDELRDIDVKTSRTKLEKAAGVLGVPVTGKSEMQIKLDIARAVDHVEDQQVISAAQAIGVYSSGADVTRLKEMIIKSLNV